MAGRDDYDETERRHDIHALSPESDRGGPSELLSPDQRSTEPPLISIEVKSVCGTDLRRDTVIDPLRWDDLAPIP
jgi:hypothetical protein